MYKPNKSKIIPSILVSKLVEQGCFAYLDYVRNIEIEAPSIMSIPVVSESSEVDPNNLPSISSDTDIDFCIYLEPSTRPISIPP